MKRLFPNLRKNIAVDVGHQTETDIESAAAPPTVQDWQRYHRLVGEVAESEDFRSDLPRAEIRAIMSAVKKESGDLESDAKAYRRRYRINH